MVTENTTPNRGYQEPAVGNTLEVDVGRLIAALRAIDVDVADALAQIVSKAGLASPAFTGTPTAPTAAPGTDSGQLATTAFVKAALAALVGLAPEALDTIEELAAASENNSDLIDLLESAVALKADAAATTAALAGKADKAITISASGLATGGGDLSANRTIAVPKASEAQAQARTDDTVALTPFTGDKLGAARDACILHVRDQKTSGTAGGSSVAGYQTRTLNTVVTNGIPGASLGSNQIALPAGTYDIKATAPAYFTTRHKASIRDAVSLADLLVGTASLSAVTNGDQTVSTVEGRLTFASPTTIELRHYTQSVLAAQGLGVETNNGQIEVYSEIFIRKVD